MQTKNYFKIRRGVPNSVEKTDLVSNWDTPKTWGCYSAAELLRYGILLDLKDGNHGANHPKVNEFTQEGLPFITASQVSGFKIDYDGSYKLSGLALEKIKVGFAFKNDVIYTHKGSVGRVAIADRECILTPQTTYYRCSPKFLNNKYLMYYLAGPNFISQVDAVKSQTTRDFVPISEQYLLFHLLPPIEEQNEIVRRVEKLFAIADSLENKYKKAIERIEKIEQAVFSKAFRGELVEADPKDEPAEELLKRILAEKEKLENKNGKRKRNK